MTNKLRDFITIFLLQLVITLPFYTASVYGLTISNARVTKVTSNSATVEWNTDLISNGRVKYGETTALGFTQRHDDFVANHTITVFNGINSDTSYLFSVESTDLANNNAIDNNSNSFYTFHTTDIMPPPQVTGLSALSATSNSILLSWNNVTASDLNHYIIYRNRIPVANAITNSFNDTGISSASSFSYKVSAVDNSGNEGPQSDTVIASTLGIDSTAPVISNVDVLPATDTTVKIKWVTDENSTTTVLFGINKTDKSKGLVELTTNHTMLLDGLVKGSQYVFVVKSCDASNNCAISSNQTFTAGKDTAIPFINLSIPRYVNRRAIDLIGSTKPFSSVTLFVNNMNVPIRSLSNNEIGSSGKFTFSQIQLQQDNVIKIVVVDRFGNKNQKIFQIGIDTDSPVVQLSDVPSLTSKIELPISGTVNEPVAINVFVDATINQVPTPSKVEDLTAAKVGQNSVELHWNESTDKDFSHYVVYREDASPIAITKPANFNLFIDALVDSGKSYTYQISQINIFANEGPKSDSITVTTLKGGAILNLRPADVDIFADFRKPVLTKNATNNFNFTIRLNKGDGTYNLKLVFTDRANNNVVLEKTITLDTKKPSIKIISPPSGSLIFENVANEIDVVGTTKPNSRVHLFVDRTPFSFFNASLELSGLPNEIQNLPEAQLDAKCRSKIVASSFCKTGADFSVDADSQGNFKFEKVDLTALFGGAARLSEVPPTEFTNLPLNPEAQESKKTTLVVIATDSTGQRGVATQSVSIGTCWSGNQSWDVIPLTQYQSPTLLSTERFAEGTETIYFYFNYSYLGRGTESKITGISLAKACGTREVIDPRFNVSCQVLPAGNSPTKLNKEGTLSYSAITLSRFPGMDQFLANDWKSFFKAINNEMTFPFKVRITYEHNIIDENGVQKKITETQTTCEQVSYVVDKSIIDPRKVLPDWLLFDFVDFLQSSIKTLTDVQEKVNQLLNYVAVGCLTSFGLTIAVQLYRRWVTFWDEKAYNVLKNVQDVAKVAELFQKNPLKTSSEDEKNYCEDTITKIAKAKGNFQMKYMTDIDLKKCFPSSASAWNAEANIYSLFRWSCDRVFGHAAPSRWTEAKSDNELINKIQSGDGCAVDQSVRGQPLRAEDCRTLIASSFPQLNKDSYNVGDKCFKVDIRGGKALYKLGQSISNNLYELEFVPGSGALINIHYAVKKDDTNYLTASSKSCAELCGVNAKASSKDLVLDGKTVFSSKDPKDKSGNEIVPYCTTVDNCRSWNAKKKIIGSDGTVHEIKYATTAGYASKISDKDATPTPCFYDAGKSVNVVSDSPATREECCCINAKETKVVTHYYQPDDKPQYETLSPVHESKSVPGQPPQSKPKPGGEGEESYSDMDWSYRYWKDKFEAQGADGTIHKEYNPNRYISGRDQSACFGQNNLIYDGFSRTDGKVLTVDPFRDHVAAFIPCVHLAGISNRIQFIKNLMTSMSTCLIQVRTTGRGDAGACKELFTQYLCGAIWQVIRAIVDGCAPSGAGINTKPEDDYSLGTYLKAGFTGLHQSVSDLQSDITSEYGNAKLNELVGTGEESIARKICLGAFGYDWEFNVKNLVDAAYTTPFATLVQPITRSREFLTVEPVSLRPKYEYRASWIINPGCDFERYDVYLTCVGRKQLDQYPNSVNCGALGAPSIGYTGAIGTSQGYSQCDCINLPDEKVGPLVFTGKLKQNILEDKAIPSGQRLQESNYRYDHLKFVLRTDRKIPPNIKPNCFPQGFDNGVFYFPLIDKTARDIADCTVDYLSGVYSCGEGTAFFSRKGTAELNEVRINGQNANDFKEESSGKPLEITARVTKTGKDKCIKFSISPDRINPEYRSITLNGTSEVSVTLTDSLRVAAGLAGSVEARNVLTNLISQNNQDPVLVSVSFIDGDDNKIYSKGDKITIDGWIVDLQEGIVKESGNQNPDTKISLNNQIIQIEKGNAKIEITGVTYISSQTGIWGDNEVIKINPPQQATQTTQTKTVTVELFHIKEDRDSYNNADDCNLNDRITISRPYTFTVSDKRADTSKLAPVIQNLRINPPKGNLIEISAKITHSSGIAKAEITIYDTDGNKIIDAEPMSNVNSEVGYLYNFDTTGRTKGQYTGKIEATRNTVDAADTTNTKSSINLKFELK